MPIIVTDEAGRPQQPAEEEYGVLLQARGQAAERLAQLELLQAYEAAPSPTSQHRNLLEFMNKGQKQPIEGRVLRENLAATRTQLELLDARLESWNERQEAYMSSLPVAKDPS